MVKGDKMGKEESRNSKINWGEKVQKVNKPMDKEITIKIKPKQLIKVGLHIVCF